MRQVRAGHAARNGKGRAPRWAGSVRSRPRSSSSWFGTGRWRAVAFKTAGPDDTRPGNARIFPEQGSLPAAPAVPCGEGGLPEKPLRRPLASGHLRIIGLKKCLVAETVTVNLPGPDRRTGGIKIKVSGRLSGKRCSRVPVWGLRTLVCARVLPGHALYLR
jgi:hypothetical protein